MNLTSAEIFSLVWDRVRNFGLYEAVGNMYADRHPVNPTGEFIVLTPLTNVTGDMQVATVNVNIYVPDDTPTINREEQRVPNRKRLGELTRIAFDTIGCYPADERWFFDISNETIISEEAIPYTFSNIKVTLKNS